MHRLSSVCGGHAGVTVKGYLRQEGSHRSYLRGRHAASLSAGLPSIKHDFKGLIAAKDVFTHARHTSASTEPFQT